MDDFGDIPAPGAPAKIITSTLVQNGPPIEPLTRVLIYGPEEWETFIHEWVSHCLKSKYQKVLRFTGANDRGIDIAGFADPALLLGVWDNYQCKHCDHPLRPSDVWPEFGKILWHSFSGSYSSPRAFYFVSPRGTGTTLTQLLSNQTALKNEIVRVWNQSIRHKITSVAPIELEGPFAAYVDQFDFSIFKPVAIREIVEQHRSSPYFPSRFGGGLPTRPLPEAPPAEIAANESIYVGKLLDAYAEHANESVPNIRALKKWEKLDRHFQRQREAFFHAESLRIRATGCIDR